MSRPDPGSRPEERPLRRDVRQLGSLVGEVLKDRGGDELFRRVESARKAAIARRNGTAGAGKRLERAVGHLDSKAATELVRAFSTYFQVVNIAEQVHRVRRRREYLRAATIPQRESFEETLGILRDAGMTLEALRSLLDRILIEPVFTAHPTEATRRVLLEKQQRIAVRLVERLNPSLTPREAETILERIRDEVTAAWQTEEHRAGRPSVADETESVLFFLTDVIYRIIPVFYESLEHAIERVHGEDPGTIRLPVLVRFASWVGGDMDGNPGVTAETVSATLSRQRDLVIELYGSEMASLARRLTASGERVGLTEWARRRIAEYEALIPEAAARIHPRYRDMPYSRLMHLMTERLRATGRSGGYGGPDELSDDLEMLLESLEAHGGRHAGGFALRRTLRRVRTFGFHLATLDVRQDARVHRMAIGDLLGDPEWMSRSDGDRARRILEVLESGASLSLEPGETASSTLAVFAAIARGREEFGARAIGPFIVSMTRGADDILGVLLLARWGGVAGADGSIPIDVAPLFETVPDLEAAPAVMESLLGCGRYRRHLESRGRHQIVMVGYSDSNKDGGLAASRWAVNRAQARVGAVLSQSGIRMTVFHGRGGTASRGGGKIRGAILAVPPGTMNGRFRVTEQGEVINTRYGLRPIAMRTLERTLGAVAIATAVPPRGGKAESSWHGIMETIASESRRVYRALVYEEPAFVRYFRAATPIDVIERMPIGSRPPSRGGGGDVSSLRAIPWVFAWTQSRHTLPAWYGLGSGLTAARAAHGVEALAAMGRDWPFFSALLDDAEMVLAKADMEIARRYASLAGEEGERFFPRIREEYERTVELILEIKGIHELLENDATLRRSIRLRNPYVDPMSLLQIDLLDRWRRTGRSDASLMKALFATVNGIAGGLRNTG